jgi:flagella basal body P-ring formation protein FlgA
MNKRSGILTVLLWVLIAGTNEVVATIGHEDIARLLRLHIVENGPWKAEDVQVQILSYTPMPLNPNTVKLRVVRPAEANRPGLHTFLIAVEREGKQEARIWVRADIRVFEEVVVSSKPLLINEVVKAKDVRVDRRDISNLNGRPFRRLNDVIGQQVTRALPVNETLTDRLLTAPQVLRRGNPIMLVYESAGLRVETPGIAEENGRAGELIQVRNPSSGKLLRGKVLDQRRVGIH